MSDIGNAYSGLKFAKDVFTSILELKIENKSALEINNALKSLGDTQDLLFELREELLRLQGENSDLTKKLEVSDNWEIKLKNYELTESEGGAIVYYFNGSPKNYACPVCIERKELHILQDRRRMTGEYECHSCDSKFPVNKPGPMPEIQSSDPEYY